MTAGRNTPPCFKCGKEMRRVWDGGHELQPSGGLCFDTTGAYGSTAFDPMDGSSLNIIVCDECVKEGARQGRVMLDQRYVGVGVLEGGGHFAAGFYVPEREAVPWDPDKEYPRQEPLSVDWEEVAEAGELHSTVMWKGSAVKFAREVLAEEKEED